MLCLSENCQDGVCRNLIYIFHLLLWLLYFLISQVSIRLVLLGYLFSGYLVVNNFGRVGFFKLSQLMLIAITVVLFVNIIMWVLFVNGFIVLDNFHYILEAYSGNRNALAFHVLVVVCLVLAFEPWYARLPLSSSQSGLLSVALSIMIGAVLITGSRSAIGTLFVVLVVAFLLRASRPMFLLK